MPPRVCFAEGYPQVELCYGEADEAEFCECDFMCQNEAIGLAYEIFGGGSCGYYVNGYACTEVWQGQCCYTVNVFEDDICGKGRPLMVEGRPRVADAVPGDDWAEPTVRAGQAVDDATRARVAAHWLEAGLDEHASIASFARFVLELTAVGAPPTLLAEAASAMRDEVRHAKLAFTLSQRFGAAPLQPGALQPPPSRPAKLEDVMVATIVEGCVGETIAAAEAELAAERATDPMVASALREIAADEARHAGLAWRFVMWALDQAPHLRPSAARAFARLENVAVMPSDPEPAGLEAYGVLSGEAVAAMRRRTLEDTVKPYAALLLEPRTGVQQRPTTAL